MASSSSSNLDEQTQQPQSAGEQHREHASMPGLYRKFANVAWNKLQSTGLFEAKELDENFQFNQAPAKGFPPGSVVQMEMKALVPKQTGSPIQYARYALLETKIPNDENNDNRAAVQSNGIQVLNFVIYPSQAEDVAKTPCWPVWGADFVSLPGGKHLLLMDAQPMHEKCTMYEQWAKWYQTYNTDFSWGGDFPPAVERYVSKNALWTRMSSTPENNDTSSSPVHRIQKDLLPIFEEHLDLYLKLVLSEKAPGEVLLDNSGAETSWFQEYLTYRLENDPARPMLKSLYGEEWTDKALHEVLFPSTLR
eukprot:CAMPEP_0198142802 /NCGR_PEP_ID=MMETSP1443-20131203/5492_1 /TAXON_ID=186043 /ORGANISM="Entomoneis sp., Strain CCMP2396" /LENGTH=306 /DNA_ID=CAMNT_0043805897 /DNA_START=365 /DNA_END=1285 /DNA_ORIENTATION=+